MVGEKSYACPVRSFVAAAQELALSSAAKAAEYALLPARRIYPLLPAVSGAGVFRIAKPSQL
jgi:hypothetical protein